MITVDIEDVIDATIAQQLKESVELLEQDLNRPDRFPIYFLDREKDIATTKHIIHCMKVVHDWYSVPSDGRFFDYSGASLENSSNS